MFSIHFCDKYRRVTDEDEIVQKKQQEMYLLQNNYVTSKDMMLSPSEEEAMCWFKHIFHQSL